MRTNKTLSASLVEKVKQEGISYKHIIKDIRLAEQGRKRVLNNALDMPGLKRIVESFGDTKPLEGARISGSVSVSYETSNFILALRKLGADIRWSPDNPRVSKDPACAFLADIGIPVFASSNMSEEDLVRAYLQVLDFRDRDRIVGPNLIIDDGSNLTRFVHAYRPELLEGIIGGTEQTTCGVLAEKRMAANGELAFPVININDAVTKLEYDNRYGIQQSLVSAFHMVANVQLRGKTVFVAGFGPVGKGCIEMLDSYGCKVIVSEIDPVLALQAERRGYELNTIEEAASRADIFITATGCINVIRSEHIRMMKDGSIICNIGHGDEEVDMAYLRANAQREEVHTHLIQYSLDGKRIRALCDGFLANTRIGSGNPPEAMSITFGHQIGALVELYNNPEKFNRGEVHAMPYDMEQRAILLMFPEIADRLTKLEPDQKAYLMKDE